MKTYTVGILACSIVRGLPGDLWAMEVRLQASDRVLAAKKAYPNIRHLAYCVTDPTIKYLSVFSGLANDPSEAPQRMHPLRYNIATGELTDFGFVIAG